MNAPLEIAIAAQHCHRNHIIFLDRRPNRFRQRSAVTNARRASIANQVKFQFVQILRKASLQQIIRHHFRARRQAGFYPGLHLQPALHSFFRQ